jgi:hypothetical protein
MADVVNIPTSEWRKLCNDIAFLKESMKVLAITKPVQKEWISEKDAKALLNVKDNRTIRKLAKQHAIAISGTSSRNIKYKASDINNFIIKNSTL